MKIKLFYHSIIIHFIIISAKSLFLGSECTKPMQNLQLCRGQPVQGRDFSLNLPCIVKKYLNKTAKNTSVQKQCLKQDLFKTSQSCVL